MQNGNMSLYELIANDEMFETEKYNAYAFGIYWSAYQAKKLGYGALTTIEFGVAGGNGLIAMEKIAELVEKEFNIVINVYGFDTGEGLPAPNDYRDLPYVWKGEQYKMDIDKLKSKLNNSKLILGNIKNTASDFYKSLDKNNPIGFISIDVDYYSSTKYSLQILGDEEYLKCIPRTLLYFDDITSTDIRYMCEDVGELLAINEWNDLFDYRKIRKIHQLRLRRNKPRLWNEQMYVCHSFKHPQYNVYIDWSKDKERHIK